MKILLFTQKIDKQDSVLGFFHEWVLKMSEIYETIYIVCLEKGDFNFPDNVKVYSLGKEKGRSKFIYIKNFYKFLNDLNGLYDSVFVHMNQEYVLLGGLYWRIRRIPVYLWRNHSKGSLLTIISVILSKKVFCTSTKSFTARFSKTVIMPVGNDTNKFRQIDKVVRKKYSTCMLGRIAPVKHIELGLEAINILVKKGIQVSFDIIGLPIKKDEEYYESLKKYVLENKLSSFVSFLGDVPFSKHPEMFSSYEICLNLTDSGSFDKSIVGAASCGSIPLVSNESLKGMLPDVCITTNKPSNIASDLEKLLNPHERVKIYNDLEKFVESQSLDELMSKLKKEIN